MPAPAQPYPTREDTERTFAAHVDAGRVAAFDALGVHLVMGERDRGRFRDAYTGRWLWDCHGNGGVFNLGHRNPAVVSAVRDALHTLDIGNHHLVSGLRARVASRLAATTGGRLSGVVFGVSGGEAVDLALKVARAHTGRTGIVSVSGGYHGHTGLALATGDPAYRDPFGPNPPGFVQVPYDDLDAMAAAIDDTTAVVIVEALPATLGFPLPRPGYLAGVQGLCRDRGALLVIDEVQTGLGRTGTVWYHEQEGVDPDIVVVGKGLSGGIYPITATLMTREVHAFFDTHPFVHVSTFGGSELGCAAAEAVLDIVTDAEFLAHVRVLGERFADGLAGLPFTLRRRGMAMAFAFPGPGDGVTAARRLIDGGVFAVYANNDPSVVQFQPPLVISEGEANEIIGAVQAALG